MLESVMATYITLAAIFAVDHSDGRFNMDMIDTYYFNIVDQNTMNIEVERQYGFEGLNSLPQIVYLKVGDTYYILNNWVIGISNDPIQYSFLIEHIAEYMYLEYAHSTPGYRIQCIDQLEAEYTKIAGEYLDMIGSSLIDAGYTQEELDDIFTCSEDELFPELPPGG